MILNPKAKKVLCFGDSLTWGHFYEGIRFPREDRWTYKLQVLLGEGYDVVEEGLRSRTTNIDDPKQRDRNGFPYLRACFESSSPVDYLVYMLGTNDTKTRFNRSAKEIREGIEENLDWIKHFNEENKTETTIILVAPPGIDEEHLKQDSAFGALSNEKLIELGDELKVLAKEKNVEFLDLSKTFKGGTKDGVHLSTEDNSKIAEMLHKYI